MTIKLVLPNIKYQKGVLESLEEIRNLTDKNHADTDYINNVKYTEENFADRIKTKLNYHNGVNLPNGRVPSTEFWIIQNGEYAGFINLRHKLNEKLMLRSGNIGYNIRPSMRGHGLAKQALFLVLEKAKDMGLTEVFIACMDTNIGSLKTILAAVEKFGGREIEKLTDADGTFRRFWINT